METYKERVRLFERLLGPQAPADVDLEAFRQLCYQGIPDDARIRPRSWKILLNYTPYDERSRWEEILRTKRETYYTFVKELVRDPTDEEVAWGKNRDHVGLNNGSDELPLNDANNSKWQMYFEELKILEQIDKDVRRTLPDFGFFQLPVPPSHLSPLHFATKDKPASASSNTDSKTTNGTELKGTRNSKPFSPIQTRRALFKRLENMYPGNDFGARSHPGSNSASDLPTSGSPASDETPSIPDRVEGEQGDLHWEAIERILFVYARLNPGIGYVQGMNEILGPLYYVMATDPDEEHRAHAEADSFFTFSALISEFRDHFIRSLDNQKQPPRTLGARQGSMGELMMERTSGNGIGNSMARMMKRIKRRDPEVYQDLQQKGIHAAFFSFRWITCLLTQEYALPDLIQLWDSILADLALDINTGSSPTASSEGINSNAASPKRSADGYLREGRFDFLIDVCCAMVVCVRDDILSGSFSDTVRLLQNYPVSDVNIVLRQAFAF
ncbi:rab-GTPase-TBC domain-containing protein, partial [Phlyctochytrium arcticum]